MDPADLSLAASTATLANALEGAGAHLPIDTQVFAGIPEERVPGVVAELLGRHHESPDDQAALIRRLAGAVTADQRALLAKGLLLYEGAQSAWWASAGTVPDASWSLAQQARKQALAQLSETPFTGPKNPAFSSYVSSRLGKGNYPGAAQLLNMLDHDAAVSLLRSMPAHGTLEQHPLVRMAPHLSARAFEAATKALWLREAEHAAAETRPPASASNPSTPKDSDVSLALHDLLSSGHASPEFAQDLHARLKLLKPQVAVSLAIDALERKEITAHAKAELYTAMAQADTGHAQWLPRQLLMVDALLARFPDEAEMYAAAVMADGPPSGRAPFMKAWEERHAQRQAQLQEREHDATLIQPSADRIATLLVKDAGSCAGAVVHCYAGLSSSDAAKVTRAVLERGRPRDSLDTIATLTHLLGAERRPELLDGLWSYERAHGIASFARKQRDTGVHAQWQQGERTDSLIRERSSGGLARANAPAGSLDSLIDAGERARKALLMRASDFDRDPDAIVQSGLANYWQQHGGVKTLDGLSNESRSLVSRLLGMGPDSAYDERAGLIDTVIVRLIALGGGRARIEGLPYVLIDRGESGNVSYKALLQVLDEFGTAQLAVDENGTSYKIDNSKPAEDPERWADFYGHNPHHQHARIAMPIGQSVGRDDAGRVRFHLHQAHVPGALEYLRHNLHGDEASAVVGIGATVAMLAPAVLDAVAPELTLPPLLLEGYSAVTTAAILGSNAYGAVMAVDTMVAKGTHGQPISAWDVADFGLSLVGMGEAMSAGRAAVQGLGGGLLLRDAAQAWARDDLQHMRHAAAKGQALQDVAEQAEPFVRAFNNPLVRHTQTWGNHASALNAGAELALNWQDMPDDERGPAWRSLGLGVMNGAMAHTTRSWLDGRQPRLTLNSQLLADETQATGELLADVQPAVQQPTPVKAPGHAQAPAKSAWGFPAKPARPEGGSPWNDRHSSWGLPGWDALGDLSPGYMHADNGSQDDMPAAPRKRRASVSGPITPEELAKVTPFQPLSGKLPEAEEVAEIARAKDISVLEALRVHLYGIRRQSEVTSAAGLSNSSQVFFVEQGRVSASRTLPLFAAAYGMPLEHFVQILALADPDNGGKLRATRLSQEEILARYPVARMLPSPAGGEAATSGIARFQPVSGRIPSYAEVETYAREQDMPVLKALRVFYGNPSQDAVGRAAGSSQGPVATLEGGSFRSSAFIPRMAENYGIPLQDFLRIAVLGDPDRGGRPRAQPLPEADIQAWLVRLGQADFQQHAGDDVAPNAPAPLPFHGEVRPSVADVARLARDKDLPVWKALRTLFGATQGDVAKAAELSQAQASTIELGQFTLTPNALPRMVHAFGMPAAELLRISALADPRNGGKLASDADAAQMLKQLLAKHKLSEEQLASGDIPMQRPIWKIDRQAPSADKPVLVPLSGKAPSVAEVLAFARERKVSTTHALRLMHGESLTQKQVAMACGVQQGEISHLELGRVNIAPYTLLKIARGYGLTLPELLRLMDMSAPDKRASLRADANPDEPMDHVLRRLDLTEGDLDPQPPREPRPLKLQGERPTVQRVDEIACRANIPVLKALREYFFGVSREEVADAAAMSTWWVGRLEIAHGTWSKDSVAALAHVYGMSPEEIHALIALGDPERGGRSRSQPPDASPGGSQPGPHVFTPEAGRAPTLPEILERARRDDIGVMKALRGFYGWQAANGYFIDMSGIGSALEAIADNGASYITRGQLLGLADALGMKPIDMLDIVLAVDSESDGRARHAPASEYERSTQIARLGLHVAPDEVAGPMRLEPLSGTAPTRDEVKARAVAEGITRLAALRSFYGVTGRQLALAAGLDPRTYASAERYGRLHPDALDAVGDALGVQAEFMSLLDLATRAAPVASAKPLEKGTDPKSANSQAARLPEPASKKTSKEDFRFLPTRGVNPTTSEVVARAREFDIPVVTALLGFFGPYAIPARVAELSGLNPGTVNGLIRGDYRLTRRSLLMLPDALPMTPEELIEVFLHADFDRGGKARTTPVSDYERAMLITRVGLHVAPDEITQPCQLVALTGTPPTLQEVRERALAENIAVWASLRSFYAVTRPQLGQAAGFSDKAVDSLEIGDYRLNRNNLPPLAQALGMAPRDLLELDSWVDADNGGRVHPSSRLNAPFDVNLEKYGVADWQLNGQQARTPKERERTRLQPVAGERPTVEAIDRLACDEDIPVFEALRRFYGTNKSAFSVAMGRQPGTMSNLERDVAAMTDTLRSDMSFATGLSEPDIRRLEALADRSQGGRSFSASRPAMSVGDEPFAKPVDHDEAVVHAFKTGVTLQQAYCDLMGLTALQLAIAADVRTRVVYPWLSGRTVPDASVVERLVTKGLRRKLEEFEPIASLPPQAVLDKVEKGMPVLQAYREERGWTQRDMALKMGLDEAAYAELEALPGGVADHPAAPRLAEVLKVDARQLGLDIGTLHLGYANDRFADGDSPIKAHREARGYSRAQAAHLSGLTVKRFTDLEAMPEPPRDELAMIARGLGLPLKDLCFMPGEKPPLYFVVPDHAAPYRFLPATTPLQKWLDALSLRHEDLAQAMGTTATVVRRIIRAPTSGELVQVLNALQRVRPGEVDGVGQLLKPPSLREHDSLVVDNDHPEQGDVVSRAGRWVVPDESPEAQAALVERATARAHVEGISMLRALRRQRETEMQAIVKASGSREVVNFQSDLLQVSGAHFVTISQNERARGSRSELLRAVYSQVLKVPFDATGDAGTIPHENILRLTQQEDRTTIAAYVEHLGIEPAALAAKLGMSILDVRLMLNTRQRLDAQTLASVAGAISELSARGPVSAEQLMFRGRPANHGYLYDPGVEGMEKVRRELAPGLTASDVARRQGISPSSQVSTETLSSRHRPDTGIRFLASLNVPEEEFAGYLPLLDRNLPPSTLRQWRLHKGYTLTQVATALGVDATSVHAHEFRPHLSHDTLQRYANLYGEPPARLWHSPPLGGRDEVRRNDLAQLRHDLKFGTAEEAARACGLPAWLFKDLEQVPDPTVPEWRGHYEQVIKAFEGIAAGQAGMGADRWSRIERYRHKLVEQPSGAAAAPMSDARGPTADDALALPPEVSRVQLAKILTDPRMGARIVMSTDAAILFESNAVGASGKFLRSGVQSTETLSAAQVGQLIEMLGLSRKTFLQIHEEPENLSVFDLLIADPGKSSLF